MQSTLCFLAMCILGSCCGFIVKIEEQRKENYYMSRSDLTGRVAIVTGGASGIGLELSLGLAEQGADVAMFARKPEKLKSAEALISEKYGRKAKGYCCDVSDLELSKEMVGRVVKDFGKIDILVNNAGVLNYGSIEDYTVEQWNQALDVDLTAVWYLTKECVLQSMRQNGYGRVINISS